MKANYSNNRHSLKRKPSSLTRFRVKKVILFQKLFIIFMMEMFLYVHFRTLREKKENTDEGIVHTYHNPDRQN